MAKTPTQEPSLWMGVSWIERDSNPRVRRF